MPYACLKRPSENSVSSFLQLPRPPKRIEAAPESGMPSSSTRPMGLWEWGALPGELPPAPGRAPRRTLAGLQGVGWECETRRPFSLGMEGRRGTDGLHSCSISVSAVCGSVAGRTFLPRCPQVNAREPGTGWRGDLLVKGCLNTCAGQRWEACVWEAHPQCPEGPTPRSEQVGQSLYCEGTMHGAYL